METFLTPKGTKLPLINLKGKFYLQVAHRLVWWREDYPIPFGRIETQCIEHTDKIAIFKAVISVYMDGKERIIAVGHGKKSPANHKDYYQTAETDAIGRALACCGYGTQFAIEFEDDELIVDSPVNLTKRNEPKEVSQLYKNNPKFDPKTHFQTGKYSGKRFQEVWELDKTYHKFLESLKQRWDDQENYMSYVKDLTEPL